MEQEKNKKKILLVDDEPINHKIVQFLMKAETEYEILGADGGRQALEILKEQKVDLVLLDIEMPDMNGKEVLSKIRECYEIPVAFVTAGEKADEEEEEMEPVPLTAASDTVRTAKPAKPHAKIERIQRETVTLDDIDCVRRERAENPPHFR